MKRIDLLQRVRSNISRHRMVERGGKVVVAVSGGPDSVALLHVLQLLQSELGIQLHVAHLNHMFRGAESEADARFVAGLAGRYGLPATVESYNVPAYRDQRRLSGQTAAREVRYRFLNEVAGKVGAARIALAHQADDQAETILHNFLRGAGTAGLKGILPVREGIYIRPLLNVRRREIEEYCAGLQLSFRNDPSNRKPIYKRNKIRLELLPLLEKEYNPGLVSTLLRLGEICREEDNCLEALAGQTFQEALAEAAAGRVVLRLAVLLDAPVAVRRRVVRQAWQALTGGRQDLSFEHTGAVLDLLDKGTTGSRTALPGKAAAVRSYHLLELTSGSEEEFVPYYIYPLQVPGDTFIPELGRTIRTGLLDCATSPAPGDLPPEEALLDFAKLPPRVYVRRRREGDYFQPYGQSSPVKLKDFLIKQKISRVRRDRIPLVCTPEEIIWAGGVRTGEKWKVEKHTTKLLYMKLMP